jgi:hypothetical protein
VDTSGEGDARESQEAAGVEDQGVGRFGSAVGVLRGSLRCRPCGTRPFVRLSQIVLDDGEKFGDALAGKGNIVVDFLHVIAIVEHA